MIGTERYGKPFGIHARSWLCALALGGFSITGHTAYANAQPPAGWSAGTGAGATYRAAANESWLSSTVRTNASLNVGGKAVQLPATMRLAANAPRFAARFLFGNPAIAVGSVVLTAWLANSNLFWNPTTQRWEKQIPGQLGTPDGFEYAVNFYSPPKNTWQTSKSAACAAEAAYVNTLNPAGQRFVLEATDTTCRIRSNVYNITESVGYSRRTSSIPPTDPTRQPVGDIEFEETMAPQPLPETAPNIIPIPWPVELPRLNPVPSPSGQPQPIRIPTGDPYKVPNSDPAEYRRPAIDIVPSPQTDAPWRVDIQPKEIPVPDLVPRPLPPPIPIPTPTPIPGPEPQPQPQPDVDPNAPPEAGEDKQPDLCEKNPDILACSKPELDTPDQEIPKRNFAVTFAQETLFGAGSCPANKTMNLRGQQITVWDFQRTCDLVTTYLKPLILTLGLFSAFMILSPGKDS